MTRAGRANEELATRAPAGPASVVVPRSGRELAGLAETLYLRLLVIALGGLQFVCALAILAALVRTSNASFWRTAGLALGLALLAALALRARVAVYQALRRRPILSLGAPLLAYLALAADGVSHSPLSYPAGGRSPQPPSSPRVRSRPRRCATAGAR